MPAHENLSPTQFGEYTLSVSKGDYDKDIPHIISANTGGKDIGYFHWNAGHGEIEDVDVDKEHQRKGVATAMYSKAVDTSKQLGFYEPVHSNLRTPSGDAWAKSVGGPNARGYNVEWLGNS